MSARMQSIRQELGADWLSAKEAARMMGTTDDDYVNRSLRPLLTHRNRSLTGKSARSVGYAYSRADCERVAEIRRVLGVTALRAAQLIFGVRRLHQLGMLEGIESQQEFDI